MIEIAIVAGLILLNGVFAMSELAIVSASKPLLRSMAERSHRGAAAAVKLEPKPLTKDRETVETFVQHNDIIEHQRGDKPLGELIAGHKKDVVVTNRLKEKPDKVAIYGWHKLDGKPIQPLYVGHADYYVDYSHGIRLLRQTMRVDGQSRQVADVLRDAELSKLISDEGSIDAAY